LIRDFYYDIHALLGLSTKGKREVGDSLKNGDITYFVAEPTNEYDHRAIKVYTFDGKMIGYVEKASPAQIYLFEADLTLVHRFSLCFDSKVESIGSWLKT
jgi:hypothetical protein